MLDAIPRFFSTIPFTQATWFTLFTLLFFVWLFAKASHDPSNPIKWEHLIIDSDNNRASPYKVGYLIGVIIGTWIVLRWADTGALTYDILGMYLTYLLGGAGVNSFAKRNPQSIQQTQYGNDTFSSHNVYQQRRVQPAQPPEDDEQIPRP